MIATPQQLNTNKLGFAFCDDRQKAPIEQEDDVAACCRWAEGWGIQLQHVSPGGDSLPVAMTQALVLSHRGVVETLHTRSFEGFP